MEKKQIDEIYTTRVEKELKILRKNLRSIKAWEIEIEVLKEKMSAYRENLYNLTPSSSSVVTIDDILQRDETKMNNLVSNIDHTNYTLKKYKGYLRLLEDREHEVIMRRYIVDTESKIMSFEKLAKEMHCAHTSAQRYHDRAIKKIAEHIYGDVEVA